MRSLSFFLLLTGSVLLIGCNQAEPPADPPAAADTIESLDSDQPIITIKPPAGFEWVDGNSTLYNKELRTSISLAHAPGVEFKSVVDDFTASNMMAANMQLVSKEIIDVDGRQTMIMVADMASDDLPKQTCTVAYPTDAGCAQLAAIYPASTSDEVKQQLREALLASKFVVPE